ncbi:MAG: hypothetical protein J6X12_02835 [Paludibacteraceae bacterium]|nr:hypothetical protein [Paludibacteraceae bacterium]
MNNTANYNSSYNVFWQFIEDYLPNYSSRDDVLWDDILSRFLEDDEVCESDMRIIEEVFNGDKKQIKEELALLETKFAQEALMEYYQNISTK